MPCEAPTTLQCRARTAPRAARPYRLHFLSLFQGQPLERCWAEVCPDSDDTPSGRASSARQRSSGAGATTPVPMKALLVLRRMDTGSLIEGLLRQLRAVLPTNVTVKEKGKVTSRYYEDPRHPRMPPRTGERAAMW